MRTLTLEVEAPSEPRREDFGEDLYAERRYQLAHRRWRAKVTERIRAQMPEGFGLFKWRVEQRQPGQWVAVAEIVGE